MKSSQDISLNNLPLGHLQVREQQESISPLQALHEVHKILGQVNILGSPIVLGSNIFEGLTTFFKEPLKAKNPKQFARGIGKGSIALVKFSAFGFLEAVGQVCFSELLWALQVQESPALFYKWCKTQWHFCFHTAWTFLVHTLFCWEEWNPLFRRSKGKQQNSRALPSNHCIADKDACTGGSDSLSLLQLTGGLSKGLALLTMDQEYVNRFSVRSVTLQQRLLQGVQALGVGAYEGLLGENTCFHLAHLLISLPFKGGSPVNRTKL